MTSRVNCYGRKIYRGLPYTSVKPCSISTVSIPLCSQLLHNCGHKEFLALVLCLKICYCHQKPVNMKLKKKSPETCYFFWTRLSNPNPITQRPIRPEYESWWQQIYLRERERKKKSSIVFLLSVTVVIAKYEPCGSCFIEEFGNTIWILLTSRSLFQV